jgi:lysyl-tRNA synthetase class 2
MLAAIRRFFEARGVLEVETPSLCHAAGADPNLQPFVAEFHLPGLARALPLYLQTSPEFAMKRLLASGSGDIYQICKAFRDEEAGRLHNPEFTLLEWYRLGFGLDALMDEIAALFAALFDGRRTLSPARRLAYRHLFRECAGVDPIEAELAQLDECARARGLHEARDLCGEDRALWLDLLFSHLIQPSLGQGRIDFVHDYPACLPSLARRKPGEPEVVERVEVFLDGMELGNGYRELTDAAEQSRRFEADLAARRARGLALPPVDARLLAALEAGLPDCSGVALGLDRLLMSLLGASSLAETLAFPVENA